MHYRDIEKRLFLKFKADNSRFLTVATIVTVVLFPALLLFLPLPGYFLMEPAIKSWEFAITLACYLLVIISTLTFHSVVIKPQYFLWAQDTFGKHRFYQHYIVNRIRFCWPLLLLPLMGFKEVNPSIGTVSQLALCYLMILLFISVSSYHTLVRTKNTTRQYRVSRLSLRFILWALLALKLRLGIAVLISVLLGYLLYYSEHGIFSTSVMAIGCALLIPLLVGSSRFLHCQLNQYQRFYISLSNNFFTQQKRIFNGVIALLWILLLILPASLAII